jgi:hypothetical protein
MSHESQLPPVLLIEHMAQLHTTSVRTIQKRRKSRVWPYTELPRIDRKPRWSREHVLAVLNGQATRRR